MIHYQKQMNPTKKGKKRTLITETQTDEPKRVKAKIAHESTKKRNSANEVCRTYSRSNKTIKQSKEANAATSPPFIASSLTFLFETISISKEKRLCQRLNVAPEIDLKQLHDERMKRQNKKISCIRPGITIA